MTEAPKPEAESKKFPKPSDSIASSLSAVNSKSAFERDRFFLMAWLAVGYRSSKIPTLHVWILQMRQQRDIGDFAQLVALELRYQEISHELCVIGSGTLFDFMTRARQMKIAYVVMIGSDNALAHTVSIRVLTERERDLDFDRVTLSLSDLPKLIKQREPRTSAAAISAMTRAIETENAVAAERKRAAGIIMQLEAQVAELSQQRAELKKQLEAAVDREAWVRRRVERLEDDLRRAQERNERHRDDSPGRRGVSPPRRFYYMPPPPMMQFPLHNDGFMHAQGVAGQGMS